MIEEVLIMNVEYRRFGTYQVPVISESALYLNFYGRKDVRYWSDVIRGNLMLVLAYLDGIRIQTTKKISNSSGFKSKKNMLFAIPHQRKSHPSVIAN